MPTLPDDAEPARRAGAALAGALLVFAAAPLCIVIGAPTAFPWVAAPYWGVVAASIGILQLVAASSTLHQARTGRILGGLGIVATLGLIAPVVVQSPGAALATLLIAIAMGAALFWYRSPPLPLVPIHRVIQLRTLALCALGLWIAVSSQVRAHNHAHWISAAVIAAVAVVLLRWAHRHRTTEPVHATIIAGSVLLTLAAAGALTRDLLSTLSSLSAPVALAIIVLPWSPSRDGHSYADTLFRRPERLFALTFASLSLIGAILLALPQSTTHSRPFDALDATFTAVSAVCVTGLAIFDTSRDFSGFGQAVILVLIQLGGLGIMTFSTVILGWLGRRLSMQHEGAVAGLMGSSNRGRVGQVARTVVLFTVAIETLGAISLAIAFAARGEGLSSAIWRAVFTSISAFCNAGFALQSDSLVAYQHDPVVLHIVALLIILGGLSPAACLAIPRYFARRTQPVPLQVRIIWRTTIAFLLFGFAVFFAVEVDASMAHLSLSDRIHNAWFQSVTLRTAGFNSIDLAQMHPATYLVTLPLMIIGGSPGGTAGGIKTTTFAVLAFSVIAAFQSHGQMTALRRRLTLTALRQATVVISLTTLVTMIALTLMLLTQEMSMRLATFEVVSALGTVGLSIGGTAQLDSVGKVVIIACMFVGRIGTLTMLAFFGQRELPDVLQWPEEEIDIG